MTSSNLQELPCLKEIAKQNDAKLDGEAIEKILNELLNELNKSHDELESTKKRNLPKIEKIKREKREVERELQKIKDELREINEIKPVVTEEKLDETLLMIRSFAVLEKRRNDFKTEGEYINKILNRNIQEEFANQMKRELKSLSNSLIELPESIDQIFSSVPGCDDINEKLDEKGIEGLPITQKTEKLLSTISKCNSEIFKKVYPNSKENCDALKKFFCELIFAYFQKRLKRNEIGSSGVASLPQFVALFLNDLILSMAFIKVHYGKIATSTEESLREMRGKYYEKFLTDQMEEISNLFSSSEDFVRNMKKISIFLNRLEKVSSSTMLKTDLVNLKLNLVNFIHKLIWDHLRSAADIGEDEIGDLMNLIRAGLSLTVSNANSITVEQSLRLKLKLNEALKLLQSSLIEIINAYHRNEYKNLAWWELEGFIGAIFATSPLRNEFIREIRLAEGDEDYEEDDEFF